MIEKLLKQGPKPTLLTNVMVISLSDTTLWTASAKATPEDYGLDAGDLPPEAIASLGSKKLINREALKPLLSIRYQMRRACAEVGTKFMGQFAVSLDEAKKLCLKLNELVIAGNKAKDEFMATFDEEIQKWHDANPRWAHILSASTPEKERIAKRITFGYIPYVAGVPNDPELAASLLNAYGGMEETLIDEIATEARQFVKSSLSTGRDDGSQRTVKPLIRIANKLRALNFIDPSIGHVQQVIMGVLACIPATGKVEGDAFWGLTRAAHVLASPKSFRDMAKSISDGKKTVDSWVTDLMEPSQPVAQAPATAAANTGLSVAAMFDDDEPVTPALVAVLDDDVKRARSDKIARQVVSQMGSSGAKAKPAAMPAASPVSQVMFDEVDF